MNLEERVTKGFIVYIQSIDYDVVNKRLVIRLLKNPEYQQQIVRTLIFYNIQNFAEELDEEDFDEYCLDSLIGLHEYPQGTGVQYLIRTQQREIVFSPTWSLTYRKKIQLARLGNTYKFFSCL